MKIGTYNIRRIGKERSCELKWMSRVDLIVKDIVDNGMDIIGVQECVILKQQYSLMKRLKDYKMSGLSWNGIICNKHSIKVLDKGRFWLSKTPNRISIGWDAVEPRFCNWVKVQEIATEKVFYVFNTHFSHVGMEARTKSAELVVEKIKELAGDFPVLLLGDFNAPYISTTNVYPIINSFLKDSKNVADKLVNGDRGTINSFRYEWKPVKDTIDFIFMKNLHAIEHETISQLYDRKFPSDHYAVTLKFEID